MKMSKKLALLFVFLLLIGALVIVATFSVAQDDSAAASGSSNTNGAAASGEDEDKNAPRRKFATEEIHRIIEQHQKDYQKDQHDAQEAAGRCHSPFGSLNGIANGVPAFSNCNDETISFEDDFVLWDPVEKRVYYEGEQDASKLPATEEIKKRLVRHSMGMRWQCVNYARRYLAEKLGLIFQDCAAAVEIWRFTFLVDPLDRGWKHRYELQRFPNFATNKTFSPGAYLQRHHQPAKQQPLTPLQRMPQAHDVVIWPMQKDMPFGHVAVVTEILPAQHPRCKELGCGKMLAAKDALAESRTDGAGEGKDTLVAVVRIGEQNYANKEWPGPKTYARELHLYRRADTNWIGLKDPDGYRVLGWLRPRKDLGEFKGAYSHSDDGEGVSEEGLIPLVKQTEEPQYVDPEEATPPSTTPPPGADL
jgi:hypothetical protein